MAFLPLAKGESSSSMERAAEGCNCRRHLIVIYGVQSALLLIFALLYWSICLDLSAIRTDLRVAQAKNEQLERFVAVPKIRERRDASAAHYYHVDQGMNDALVIGGAVPVDEPKLLLPIYAKVSVGDKSLMISAIALRTVLRSESSVFENFFSREHSRRCARKTIMPTKSSRLAIAVQCRV